MGLSGPTVGPKIKITIKTVCIKNKNVSKTGVHELWPIWPGFVHTCFG